MPSCAAEPAAKKPRVEGQDPDGATTSESSAFSSCTDSEESSQVEDLDAELNDLHWLRQTAAGKLHVVRCFDQEGYAQPWCQEHPFNNAALETGQGLLSGLNAVEKGLCIHCIKRMPSAMRRAIQEECTNLNSVEVEQAD